MNSATHTKSISNFYFNLCPFISTTCHSKKDITQEIFNRQMKLITAHENSLFFLSFGEQLAKDLIAECSFIDD